MGCSKTVPKTPLEFQKELLAGSGTYLNTQRIWQLDSTKINGVNSVLSSVQKNYKKTFTFDGKYSDTDNNNGKWEITTLNKLKTTYVYQFSTKQDSITYDIISINAAQMSLSIKLSNGQTANYSFKITN
jgi:ABC-type Na+ efflux pump permease subunit